MVNVKDEIQEEIAKVYNEGMSLGKLSDKFDLTKRVLRRILGSKNIEIRNPSGSNGVKVNLLDKVYGRLTVIKDESVKGEDSKWRCKCECGEEVVVKTEYLQCEDTRSCGCLNMDQRKANAQKMYSTIVKYTPEEAGARDIYRDRYQEVGGVTYEEFYKLSQMNCDYCGAAPANVNKTYRTYMNGANEKENGYFIYNGLDRVDSSLPHTLANCVPCCYPCNWMKRALSVADFKAQILKIAAFMSAKQP